MSKTTSKRCLPSAALHAVGVVAVRHEIRYFLAEGVLGLAVQNRDLVAGLQQLRHQQLPDERVPPITRIFMRQRPRRSCKRPVLSRNIRGRGA